MGRGPTNENTNMYFQARKKAATYNERLWSREGAAELLGISVSTLADYELGNTKVANEYRDRALLLPSNGLQDIGGRRKLREELQTRCNLTELQAVNIINGFHIPDYVRIAEVRAAKEAQEHEN